jgi:phospholipid/cholesterol/gamma-HCH transport system permease protein
MLISFLVGMILPFVGAVQLKQFGARIYVADLASIAMVREMGAIMPREILARLLPPALGEALGKLSDEIVDAIRAFDGTRLPLVKDSR